MSIDRTLAGRPGHNRGQTYPAEVLTADEVRALMRATNRGNTGIRNRALIAVLYRAGLRLSEALALKPSDVDVDGGTIRVLHGKGDRARTVGLDHGAAALVGRWLDQRRNLGLNGRRRLFTKLDGSKWSPQGVREMLKRAAAKAGIEKRVHPHGLRHTHAAELAREGAPTNLIQAQLGHASLAVTDRYLRHIAPRELVETIRRRAWDL
ncbi:MAG: site-specific integrase [Thermoleophilia bacterium]|nr:site-specific integrase [Thermoleophilia bacterium]